MFDRNGTIGAILVNVAGALIVVVTWSLVIVCMWLGIQQ